MDESNIKRIAHKNYKAIFTANALLSVADGFYYPFLIVFLHELGDILLVGGGLGLIIIFEAAGSYLGGKWADAYGRKPLFLISIVISIIVYLSYPLLPFIFENKTLLHLALAIILIVDGINGGAWSTVEGVYLGDITTKASRGRKFGSYWGAAGLFFGAAMIGAGLIGIYINFLIVAIITVLIYITGLLILLRIKDTLRS